MASKKKAVEANSGYVHKAVDSARRSLQDRIDKVRAKERAAAERKKAAKKAAADKAKVAKAKAAVAKLKSIRTGAMSALRALSKAKMDDAARVRELVNDAVDTHVSRHGQNHKFNAIHVTKEASRLLKASNGPVKYTLSNTYKWARYQRKIAADTALKWAKANPVK